MIKYKNRLKNGQKQFILSDPVLSTNPTEKALPEQKETHLEAFPEFEARMLKSGCKPEDIIVLWQIALKRR